MNQESQVQVTQEDIRVIKKEVTDFGEKLSDIHYALVGNAMTKDGGLIQRVIDLEKQKEDLATRVEAMEKDDIKSRVYVKSMWGMAGAAIMAIFAYVVEHLFKSK